MLEEDIYNVNDKNVLTITIITNILHIFNYIFSQIFHFFSIRQEFLLGIPLAGGKS